MPVAFSTASLRTGVDRLVAGAARARELGFSYVHAAAPPTDAARAREALGARRVGLTAVSTAPLAALDEIDAAIDRAAAAAAALHHRTVVVEAGALEVPAGAPLEAAVERLVRALHAALRRHGGLTLALATAAGPASLLRAPAPEWILSELDREPFGFWFDAAGALRIERTPDGEIALAFADRYGSRVLGVAAAGLGGGAGHAPPEDDGLDWGTLRGLVPSRAPYVLDLAPTVSAAGVEAARRHLEHVLFEGA